MIIPFYQFFPPSCHRRLGHWYLPKIIAKFLKTNDKIFIVKTVAKPFLRYENENIVQMSLQPPTKRRLRFNRSEFKNLCDIKLKSQDGSTFLAHKCILAARVEYFKGILGGSWREVNSIVTFFFSHINIYLAHLRSGYVA